MGNSARVVHLRDHPGHAPSQVSLDGVDSAQRLNCSLGCMIALPLAVSVPKVTEKRPLVMSPCVKPSSVSDAVGLPDAGCRPAAGDIKEAAKLWNKHGKID
jgi:hypothetical protein